MSRLSSRSVFSSSVLNDIVSFSFFFSALLGVIFTKEKGKSVPAGFEPIFPQIADKSQI